MSWLWIIGPVLAALVFVLTDRRDKRRETEVERWRTRMGSPKAVDSLPGPFVRMILAAGAGQRVGYYELVSKLAYAALLGGDAVAGSDHQTVVAKLDESAPTFTVRPLPLLDGVREANTGVQFKKDEEFMEAFIVERGLGEDHAIAGSGAKAQAAGTAMRVAGAATGVPALRLLGRLVNLFGPSGTPAAPEEPMPEDKAIRKWLSPPVRAALLELPDVWLRVDGKMMALTLYGHADADKLNELITAADVIFAEHGAEGGPSLFGDDEDDEAPAEAEAAPPPKKKAAGAKKPSAGKSA